MGEPGKGRSRAPRPSARWAGSASSWWYDTALRVGAKLRLEPSLVYLHRGTREGVLGFDGGAQTLRPGELPRAFRRLAPREIEDCLCIYKAELRKIAARAGRQRSRPGPRKGT